MGRVFKLPLGPAGHKMSLDHEGRDEILTQGESAGMDERSFQGGGSIAGFPGWSIRMSRIVTIIAAFFLWLHLSAPLHGQEGSELTPRGVEGETEGRLPFGKREPVLRGEVDESAVLVIRLGTIKLIGSGEGAEFNHDFPEAGRVEALGLTIEHGGLAEALRSFLGEPLTESGLDQLIETLLRYYEAHDRPVTDIYAPDQDLAGGTIELMVIDGLVGSVGMQMGGIFNEDLLAGALRLQGGEVLLTSELQRHLDWFNRNPFRPAALYAAPGAGAGEADLVFAFSERRPWRVYAGYENSGAEVSGENRFLTGFNWGNVFGLDQSLSYQFTTADSLDELSAHAVNWEIPIHSRHHFLRLTGSWAEISTQGYLAGLLVDSAGTSWQLGASYGVQLNRWNDFRQELSVGAEFKSSDNFLVYGGLEGGPGAGVEVIQFRTDYRARRQFANRGSLELNASVVGSPGELGGRNSTSDFQDFRPGAEASYLYGRARAVWTKRLPGAWTLRARGQFQVGSGALLPTEQLSLGGHATVRGFEERDFLADRGYLLSAEVRTPPVTLPTGEHFPVQVQFLGFLDHGGGWRDEITPGREDQESLTSMGAGLRAQVGRHLNLRADVGVPLEGGDGPRGHVGLTASF